MFHVLTRRPPFRASLGAVVLLMLAWSGLPAAVQVAADSVVVGVSASTIGEGVSVRTAAAGDSARPFAAGASVSRVAGVVANVPVQTQPDIAVVVHPSVTIDNLPLADLRRILTGDREFWAAGSQRVTIFIRAPIARERDAVVRDVCQMTEAQFRQHWIGKVFRAETPSGPKIVYSADSTIEQVSRTPGAVGLVQIPVTAKGVKVLKIDGRSPGQAGYKLK